MKKVICLLLAITLMCGLFVGCSTDKLNNEVENIKDKLEEIEKDENNKEENSTVPEETLLDFENFCFEVKGVKFENFETFGSYLDLNPTPWEGHELENVLSLEGCNFKVQDGDKYNDFSLTFYDDGAEKSDRDVIVSSVFVYWDSENSLDFKFPQEVKIGDNVKDILQKYGKPTTQYDDEGKIQSICYENEDDWIAITFEFDENEKLRNFRIEYDYNCYLESLENQEN